VPVGDARDNLGAVVELARAHHAKVLLMTEGLNPDPAPMRPYGEMLAGLQADDVAWLDAAGALWEADDPTLFLDDCHLSVPGHERLATMVEAKLRALGWL
jgi:lysophospholipase L1-like esterase